MSAGDAAKRVIDGRFELLDRLGGGGMGLVWRARDLALDREVAVKEVRPPDPSLAEYDPEGARTLRARVLREARALARVDHPNVVTIHHIVDGGDGTYPWIVMELVTGGSLQDRLGRGTLAPEDAAVLGREILAALRAAHAAGIEHRDVKPANVLLRPDGRPVLTDFGIAAIRESTALTATGSVIGSPDYMAPERVSGRPGGPAADLWSLGMLLYVAVEGHHPLRRESTLATLAAVLNEGVPPPRRAGPLTTALRRLLVRDPAQRASAEEVEGMLARVLAGVGNSGSDTRSSGPGSSDTGPTDTKPGPSRPSRPSRPSPRIGPAPTSFRLAPPAPRPLGDAVARRRVRRARAATGLVALGGTALIGVLVWTFLPVPEDRAGEPGGRTTAPASAPAAAPADRKSDEPATPTDLLTPDGIRTAVRELKPLMGGGKVTGFVVYPEHVSAQALVKGSTKRYDRFAYRGGDGATRDGAGGTVMSGTVPVDLAGFDWDAVPALVRRADKELGIKHPTGRYLVVNTASTVFESQRPGMSVYVSDDYGSAYLKADTKGKVIAAYPRSD
ncbi:serine/threonine-protein kinase [Streptomyces sp. NPDC059002]|uniref:serine/threonine-protein kinase n=1 Tax=Streptomyces sp. NPDC059002 TaxID=3346690 RepID=UPI003693A6CB